MPSNPSGMYPGMSHKRVPKFRDAIEVMVLGIIVPLAHMEFARLFLAGCFLDVAIVAQ